MAVGNTVVLKPSEESPLTGGGLWAELFASAGLPPGVLNVVTHAPGDAGTLVEELISNPGVGQINFTGSTVVGHGLAEAAGNQPQSPPVVQTDNDRWSGGSTTSCALTANAAQ